MMPAGPVGPVVFVAQPQSRRRTATFRIAPQSKRSSPPAPPPTVRGRGRLGGGGAPQEIAASYSYRSAWIGCTFAARSAGYSPDSTPTASDTVMARAIDVTVTTVGHFA